MSSDSSPDHIDHVDQLTTKVTKFDLSQLPASFKQFLKENDVDPEIYTVDALPRYVRLNTHLPMDKRPTLEDMRQQLCTDQVHAVEKLQDFYRIQLGDQRISDTQAYKEHAIFGIDLSSAIAVEALSLGKDDQVLDLCCAPGAKLCMIANLLGREGLGTVTGVDVAAHRLATCRSLLKKYRVGEKVRLFEADGTTFQVPPPSRLGSQVISKTQEQDEPKAKKQKTEIVKPFWASKMLRFDPQQKCLYDKVLVDAECTHDGSILHILKYEKWGWDAFEKNFMDPQRLNNIVQLQRDLMRQGWHMLKPGGTMVYSTCSLSIRQNEENIAWFLHEHDNAKLQKIPDYGIQPAKIKQQKSKELQNTIEEHCVRFDPISSRTSGFFLACFIKQL